MRRCCHKYSSRPRCHTPQTHPWHGLCRSMLPPPHSALWSYWHSWCHDSEDGLKRWVRHWQSSIPANTLLLAHSCSQLIRLSVCFSCDWGLSYIRWQTWSPQFSNNLVKQNHRSMELRRMCYRRNILPHSPVWAHLFRKRCRDIFCPFSRNSLL